METVETEIVEDLQFRFDIDHQKVSLELGGKGWSFVINVVFSALVKALNLFSSLWNAFLSMLSGGPLPQFTF